MRPEPLFVGGSVGGPKRNAPIGRPSTWPGRNRNGDSWGDVWQNWPTRNISRRPVDSGGGRTTNSRAVDGAPEEWGGDSARSLSAASGTIQETRTCDSWSLSKRTPTPKPP